MDIKELIEYINKAINQTQKLTETEYTQGYLDSLNDILDYIESKDKCIKK